MRPSALEGQNRPRVCALREERSAGAAPAPRAQHYRRRRSARWGVGSSANMVPKSIRGEEPAPPSAPWRFGASLERSLDQPSGGLRSQHAVRAKKCKMMRWTAWPTVIKHEPQKQTLPLEKNALLPSSIQPSSPPAPFTECYIHRSLPIGTVSLYCFGAIRYSPEPPNLCTCPLRNPLHCSHYSLALSQPIWPYMHWMHFPLFCVACEGTCVCVCVCDAA